MLAAFTLLVLAKVLLWLTVIYLPELITWLGLATLFTAFVIMLVTGLLAITKGIILGIRAYFSAQHRKHRRLWFMQARHDQTQQLFHFKTAQIRYFHDLKRKKLLAANNRRHIQTLSKAIEQELSAATKQLPKTVLKELQRENKYYRNRQDCEALLKLQQKIASLT